MVCEYIIVNCGCCLYVFKSGNNNNREQFEYPAESASFPLFGEITEFPYQFLRYGAGAAESFKSVPGLLLCEEQTCQGKGETFFAW